ncbi:MAG TPA: tetratricopeptide repeat protein [Ignavibacteriaceae bacterium]|nr:tetratricopeptide repeat protein [Ignavibacteriaceae bacterium]
MLTKKKKLSRREIKEDKLVSTYYKAYGYFEENRKRILTYAGALGVVVLLVYLYLHQKNVDNEEAGFALSKVLPAYDNGSYLEAIEGRQGIYSGLKKIVEEYGSSENGEAAKIYLANSYSMLGKSDEALKYYKDYGGSNALFKASALAGEASYYSVKKDYTKAAELYKDASKVSEDNILNPEYMLNAAINYINAGDTAPAKELLTTIKKEYTDSPARREVDKYLAVVD